MVLNKNFSCSTWICYLKVAYKPTPFEVIIFGKCIRRITIINVRINPMTAKIAIFLIGGHKMCLIDRTGFEIHLKAVSGRLKEAGKEKNVFI